jgi:hypothetical protein
MAEEDVYRIRKDNTDNTENQQRLNQAEELRKMAQEEERVINKEDFPFEVKGNLPPQLLNKLQNKQNKTKQVENISGSTELKEILEAIKSKAIYETINLPSGGKFYNGEDGPADGVINIRPMTGEEEQILATQRFVKKGTALDMIFSRCIKESYRVENFLTVDRTYLLIYLRGISYSNLYEVEIKCPECESKFSTEIDLNDLEVEYCPENFGPILEDRLPSSGLNFSYRLSRGGDEAEIQKYRERRIKNFGDASDDTLIYRTAMLLEKIEGITDKKELQTLIRNLPISDVNYLRNCTNEPPFGVDTKVSIACPMCLGEFEAELPLESNFFFPRKKKEKE